MAGAHRSRASRHTNSRRAQVPLSAPGKIQPKGKKPAQKKVEKKVKNRELPHSFEYFHKISIQKYLGAQKRVVTTLFHDFERFFP